MAIVIASAHLSDEQFMSAFSSCELPPSSFRHGDHLRFAWLQLHRSPFSEAERMVRESIWRYAARHNSLHVYHETVTIAWLKLLATHREATFKQFITENEGRLNPSLLHRFWSPAALNSERARQSWLPPDKEALPN